MSVVDKIKEKLQKIVRLIVIKARNTLGICRIDEEIHAAGNRTQETTWWIAWVMGRQTTDFSLLSRNSCQIADAVVYIAVRLSRRLRKWGDKFSKASSVYGSVSSATEAKEGWGGSLTFEIMVSPLTLDGDSSIQKKYNPRGCNSGDFMLYRSLYSLIR